MTRLLVAYMLFAPAALEMIASSQSVAGNCELAQPLGEKVQGTAPKETCSVAGLLKGGLAQKEWTPPHKT